MKTSQILLFLGFSLLLFQWPPAKLKAQVTHVVDFEGSVPANQDYLNGSEQPLGTTYIFNTPVGPLIFPNFFDTIYGGFWTQGWALSRRADSTTASAQNIYGVKAYSGHNGSQTFAVGLGMARLRTHQLGPNGRVKSLYVTNTTWNYEAMLHGLGISKKFGGVDGTDPDYFKLVVKRYVGGQLQPDSAEIYLADYRFPGASSQDYILKSWVKLDLNLPAPMDSLIFILRSSDITPFGMATPPYFAVDDVEVEGSGVSLTSSVATPHVMHFTTPDGTVILSGLPSSGSVFIYDVTGKLRYSSAYNQGNVTIPAGILSSGIFFVHAGGALYKIIVN